MILFMCLPKFLNKNALKVKLLKKNFNEGFHSLEAFLKIIFSGAGWNAINKLLRQLVTRTIVCIVAVSRGFEGLISAKIEVWSI